jgi:hypothetical protein
MPTVKQAHQFMNRQGAAFLVLCVLFMLLVAVIVIQVPDVFWQKVAGVVLFLLVVASWVGVAVRAGRAFKCLDCGGPVGPFLETDKKPGTPILRHCQACDVLWQVGVESD